jgi:hypothetical protein
MSRDKRAETSFRALIKGMGGAWHKYGDVRYCIHCHHPLPKTEKAPDFLAALLYTWVECKNSNSTGRWDWAGDIGPDGARTGQRQWLTENQGWLFIELGQGRADRDQRSCYLIQWSDWLELEPTLQQKSIRKESHGRFIGGDELFSQHRLVWVNSQWEIPPDHSWWDWLSSKLEATEQWVKMSLNKS